MRKLLNARLFAARIGSTAFTFATILNAMMRTNTTWRKINQTAYA
jgi:hypothetical protein